jgi:hypothetical protein
MSTWRLFLFLCLMALPGYGAQKKVLIIGIDGLMPSAMAVARTPNLDQLKSNGCYSVRVVTHAVTHSAACWTSMFTGVWGDKHGVNDPGNSFTGNRLSEYPSFFKHIKDADSSLQTLCFARWSPLLTVVPDAQIKLAFDSDAAVTEETCRRLTNSNPDVFYMILLDVDSAGHTYGWGATVPNYVKAIEAADGRVGAIISALHSRATYSEEDWLVICLSDHGEHDNPDPERSRITFHIISGNSAARGVLWPAPSIVDICATVLTHMGVSIDPAWGLDARLEGLAGSRTYFDTNLIYNGDAEANSGANDSRTNRGVAWWTDLGVASLGVYGSNASFPEITSPGPADRGSNFFAGGTTNSLMTQRVNLSAIGTAIDSGQIAYALSGWFGGSENEDDVAGLTAAFLDANALELARKEIGGVSSADRGGVTGLLIRSASDNVPVGSRFVDFTLVFSSASGLNNASADNLSFVLHAPSVPIAIETWSSGPAAVNVSFNASVGRTYVLQRSIDFQSWEDVSDPQEGTGQAATLKDAAPPADRAFYRIRATSL